MPPDQKSEHRDGDAEKAIKLYPKIGLRAKQWESISLITAIAGSTMM